MRVTARFGLAGAVVSCALWASSAPASADPDQPVDPAPMTVLGSEVAVNPITALGGLLASSPAMLGLAALPPETVSSGPGPDPLTSGLSLLPQNYRMPTGDQASPYQLAPNDTPSPFGRIDAWKGVHALAHGGLGRMPGGDLGQPLPGTDAPPGVNIPAGLEQFYVDPAVPPAPAVPAALP